MMAVATLALIALNSAVYLLQGALTDASSLASRGALLPSGLAQHEYWRLVSAVVLHGSVAHLVVNMLLLADLGSLVEDLTDATWLVLSYIACGLAGSAGSLMWLADDIPRVGASGAIFGLAGIATVLLIRDVEGRSKSKAAAQ